MEMEGSHEGVPTEKNGHGAKKGWHPADAIQIFQFIPKGYHNLRSKHPFPDSGLGFCNYNSSV